MNVPVVHSLTSAITSSSSLSTNGYLTTARNKILAGENLVLECPRILTPDQLDVVYFDLASRAKVRSDEYVRKAQKQGDLGRGILKILKESSLSIKLSGFGNPRAEQVMLQKLRPMIEQQSPISLALLMGGGKVANPLKTGDNILPDLSEWHAWSLLQSIADAVSAIYAPGASVIAIPDAALHTADLGFPVEDTRAHHHAVVADLKKLGFDRVIVPDIVPLMDFEWADGVRRFVGQVRDRYQSDPQFAQDVQEQINSLVYSTNTRLTSSSIEELALAYSVVGGSTDHVNADLRRRGTEMMHRAEEIAFHYVAVNWAIRQLKLVERVTEQVTGSRLHFRMSVHAKSAEPRPKLFDNSDAFPGIGGLLPMHALGTRILGPDKTRYGAKFFVEAIVRGLKPVHDENGRFVWFEMSSAAE